MTEGLLYCPFCDSTDVRIIWTDEEGYEVTPEGATDIAVLCDCGCHLFMPITYQGVENDLESIRRKWNTRGYLERLGVRRDLNTNQTS